MAYGGGGAALVGGLTGSAAPEAASSSSSSSSSSSFDERKRKRELDEARKAGLIAPEKDAEGNLINPHIPEFMSNAPWYVSQEGPGLQHQRKTGVESESGDTWDARRDNYDNYDASQYLATVARRYDRQEAQRKAKRAEMREQRRAERKRAREAERKDRQARVLRRRTRRAARLGLDVADIAPSDTETDSGDDGAVSGDSDDEDVRLSSSAAAGQSHSLRNREEVAKYLHNLDTDSAFYEPGTRSMRENPNPQARPGQAVYRGDNELLQAGPEVAELAKTQLAAWEAYNRGHDITMHGNPTAAEKLRKAMEERVRAREELRRRQLAARYKTSEGSEAATDAAASTSTQEGNAADHLQGLAVLPAAPPRSRTAKRQTAAPSSSVALTRAPTAGLRLAAAQRSTPTAAASSSSSSSSSSATAAAVVVMPSSRYEEDVLEGSHTAIFGSFYDPQTHRWGYACCQATQRSRRCTGAAGIAARALAERLRAARHARQADAKQPQPQKQQPQPHSNGPSVAGPALQAAESAPAGPSLLEEVAEAITKGEHVPRPVSERPAPVTSSSAYGGSTDVGGDGGGGYGEEDVGMLGAAAGGGTGGSRRGLRMQEMADALRRRGEEEEAAEERDERRRGFMSGSLGGKEEGSAMSAEEMEAYQLTRQRAADPMAGYRDEEDDDDDK